MHENSIAAAYDRWAESYDECENKTRDLAHCVIAERASTFTRGTVIEVGCGTGRNTRELSKHHEAVVALDFSPEMLRRARSAVTASNVRFEQQDVTAGWNVASETIDLVVCSLVLEHIHDLSIIVTEVARVCRSGASILICELHPFRQLLGKQARFKDTQSGVLTEIASYVHPVSEYVNALLNNGFELERMDELSDHSAERTPRLLVLQARKKR
jgi:ubiquinone/menaquinone biosynthesis C-methylase UbiE